MDTTKVKGRKEVFKILRDWEQYGMEDVYMDKANNVVHGRVGEVNCKGPPPLTQISLTISQFSVFVLSNSPRSFTPYSSMGGKRI